MNMIMYTCICTQYRLLGEQSLKRLRAPDLIQRRRVRRWRVTSHIYELYHTAPSRCASQRSRLPRWTSHVTLSYMTRSPSYMSPLASNFHSDIIVQNLRVMFDINFRTCHRWLADIWHIYEYIYVYIYIYIHIYIYIYIYLRVVSQWSLTDMIVKNFRHLCDMTDIQISLWKTSDLSKNFTIVFPHCEKFQISLWHFRDSHIWHMYESCHIEIWFCFQWYHRAKCTSHVLWVMLDVRRYSVEWLVHMGGSDVWESIYHVSRYFLHVSVSHIGHT